ncbi:hypothetical protein ACLKA6_019978 [Drosophila palustris]
MMSTAPIIDENFMPNSSCERITIDCEHHRYTICMSNRRIFIVKLSKIHNGATKTSSSSSTSVYSDATEGNNINTLSARSSTVLA